MTKTEQALKTCEQVLEGVELGTLTTSSVLLQCLRIARLLNDTEAITWFQYEYGGYPKSENGHILSDAFQIAYKNGRGGLSKDGKQEIFLDLVSELEAKIVSSKSALNNFSTQGASVSGNAAYIAMRELTGNVARSTSSILTNISTSEKRLSILKSRYYDYALRKQIELTFSNTASKVFSSYRENVDNYLSEISSETILKLQAIEDKLNSDNPELYSQALTTCRRLFADVAKELFKKHFPDYQENTYKTKSGKDIDITRDHYKNMLSAVIEKLQDKNPTKTLVGSQIIYLLDWIDNLSELQCKGVHADITKHDAMQCIIHTYICLGDVLALQE